jgi:hypothetical protein
MLSPRLAISSSGRARPAGGVASGNNTGCTRYAFSLGSDLQSALLAGRVPIDSARKRAGGCFHIVRTAVGTFTGRSMWPKPSDIAASLYREDT